MVQHLQRQGVVGVALRCRAVVGPEKVDNKLLRVAFRAAACPLVQRSAERGGQLRAHARRVVLVVEPLQGVQHGQGKGPVLRHARRVIGEHVKDVVEDDPVVRVLLQFFGEAAVEKRVQARVVRRLVSRGRQIPSV